MAGCDGRLEHARWDSAVPPQTKPSKETTKERTMKFLSLLGVFAALVAMNRLPICNAQSLSSGFSCKAMSLTAQSSQKTIPQEGTPHGLVDRKNNQMDIR